MSGICIYMGGAKCAEQYCDFWDHEEQKCSIALETIRRAGLLGIFIKEFGKIDGSKIDNIVDDKKLHFLFNQMIGEQYKMH